MEEFMAAIILEEEDDDDVVAGCMADGGRKEKLKGRKIRDRE
jgi:hypothetical protein